MAKTLAFPDPNASLITTYFRRSLREHGFTFVEINLIVRAHAESGARALMEWLTVDEPKPRKRPPRT